MGRAVPPSFIPSPEDFAKAGSIVKAHLGQSPLEEISLHGGYALLKLELFMPTRSFKVRGALLTAWRNRTSAGLVTASTGNFGLALAFAGSEFGLKIHVFAPEHTCPVKLKKIERLGADIHLAESLDDATVGAQRFAAQRHLHFVSAYNSKDMILGAMTIVEEVSQQASNIPLSEYYCPVGGGGLISGVGIAARATRRVKCVAVYPETSTALYNAVHCAHLVNTDDSVAEALVGGIEAQSLTIELTGKLVDLWVPVTDPQIKRAMRTLLEEANIISEGAGATALAGLEQRQDSWKIHGMPVAIVSGGNISFDTFSNTVGRN